MYLGDGQLGSELGWMDQGINYLGIGLAGEVEVWWNGRLAYKGTAQRVDLGDGIEPRYRYIKEFHSAK